jgi:phosphate transport system substrate-binding protein
MNWVQVQNRDGQWVAPDDLTFQAAAAGAKWNETFYQILTDQPGKTSWPITGATFIIMHLNSQKPAEAKEAIKFFIWALDKGDKMALDLDYVPMPDAVVTRIKAEMAKIK